MIAFFNIVRLISHSVSYQGINIRYQYGALIQAINRRYRYGDINKKRHKSINDIRRYKRLTWSD